MQRKMLTISGCLTFLITSQNSSWRLPILGLSRSIILISLRIPMLLSFLERYRKDMMSCRISQKGGDTKWSTTNLDKLSRAIFMMKWLINFTKGTKEKIKSTISGIFHTNYLKSIIKRCKNRKLTIRDTRAREMISTMHTSRKREKRCGSRWLEEQLLSEYLRLLICILMREK